MGRVRFRDLDQLDQELRRAASGPDEDYAVVLERALAVCATNPLIAEELDDLELHSDLADVYDRLGRVEEALEQADVLVERGYPSSPDPRCRRADILMRHGRAHEAAPIWAAVLRDTPDDIWLFNNAGLEYGAAGDHEAALDWLTRGLELPYGPATRNGSSRSCAGCEPKALARWAVNRTSCNAPNR